MIKDVVSYLDYSVCAEVSLAIFVVVFVAVTLQTLLSGKTRMEGYASIPLDEGRKEKAK